MPELGVARLLEPEDLIKLTSPPQSPMNKIVEAGILFDKNVVAKEKLFIIHRIWMKVWFLKILKCFTFYWTDPYLRSFWSFYNHQRNSNKIHSSPNLVLSMDHGNKLLVSTSKKIRKTEKFSSPIIWKLHLFNPYDNKTKVELFFLQNVYWFVTKMTV